MKHITDFEKELQALDSRFSVKQNPNITTLYNIFFDGKNYDLPPIPEDIKEEPDEGYRCVFPNGVSARYWSVADVMPRLKRFLEQFNAGEYEDLGY